MKRFKSKWYSIEDIRKVNNEHRYVKDPNGYLYAKAKYNTKIKAEDLPEWYIYGRFYKRFGYLSSKDVVDLHYIPNKVFNHFLKDDDLFISYSKPIDKSKSNIELLCEKDCYCVDGSNIINMLLAIKKYSNYDITSIVEQIKDKQQWFKDNYPQDYKYECNNLNLDEVFEKKNDGV